MSVAMDANAASSTLVVGWLEKSAGADAMLDTAKYEVIAGLSLRLPTLAKW